MPKALEHYIAVTDYKKQEKGEITLRVGMLVEIVEKTETGKLCRLCSEEYSVFLFVENHKYGVKLVMQFESFLFYGDFLLI